MQHVENDMDDLFQRAAENYPLQNNEGDWDSIARQINPSQTDAKTVVPLQKKSYKKLIAWLLLFAALSTGDLLLRKPTNELSFRIVASELINQKENLLNKSTKENKIAGYLNQEEITGIEVDKKVTGDYSHTSVAYSGKDFTNKTSRLKRALFYTEKKFENSNKNKQDNYLMPKDVSDNNITTIAVYNIKEKSYNLLADNNRHEIEKILTTGKMRNVQLHNSSTRDSNIVDYKKDKILTAASKKKTFYIGVAGGPDFSKVQSASFNNIGFDAGLLAGMSINNKVSFETGILWNKKNYRSRGTQFSMDKVRSTMPPGMIINNLESESSLLEIPLKIKYNFTDKRNAGLFATAGISAYIMTKEKNMYNVTMNGNPEKLIGVYGKYNFGLPAVVNFSIGYEHPVSSYLDIRIEPFLKIPLQGIGVGSLPITSTGLQIGIVHLLK